MAANSAAGGQGNSTAVDVKQSGYDPEAENEALSKYLLVTCASLSAALIIWRLVSVAVRHLRTMACLQSDTQRYFAVESSKLSLAKKHLLYAPIFRKRHNREFQLSSAITVGTLPTRFQLLFLVGYVATNVAFCVISIPFAGSFSAAASMVRQRTGSLAVVNMVSWRVEFESSSFFARIFLHCHRLGNVHTGPNIHTLPSISSVPSLSHLPLNFLHCFSL